MERTWKTTATFFLNNDKYNVLKSNDGHVEIEWERKLYGRIYRSLVSYSVFGKLDLLNDSRGTPPSPPPKPEVKIPVPIKNTKKKSNKINKAKKSYNRKPSKRNKLKKRK